MKTSIYRPDIDGLRALAIIAVVLYHAGVPYIGGGFVGVDIFFVISGYVIASKIHDDISKGRWSVQGFLEGRVRRLFPALVPALLFTTAVAFLLLEPTLFYEFSQSLIWSAFSAANWFFMSEVGYFDGPAHTKPLLHLWSLGVENQFYLLFAGLVLLSTLWKRWSNLWVWSALAIASFIYASWATSGASSQQAFFDPFARVWELLVGAILFALPRQERVNSAVTGLAFSLGVGFIFTAIIFFSPEVNFPGYAALLPVAGTALIIWSGTYGGLTTRTLGLRWLVSIGKASYGWYIWHWPLMVLAAMYFSQAVKDGYELPIKLAAGAVSLALGFASARFLEGPIRQRRFIVSNRTMGSSFVVGTAFFVALGIPGHMPWFSEARAWMLDGKKGLVAFNISSETEIYRTQYNLNADRKRDLPGSNEAWRYTCSYDRGNTSERVLECVKRLAKERNIIVAGDSIGRDLFHSLRIAYPGTNFIMIHNSGCPPWTLVTKTFSCFPRLDILLKSIEEEINVDAVLMSFRYKPDNIDRISPALSLWGQHFDNIVVLGVSPIFTRKLEDYVLSVDRVPENIAEDDKSMVSWSFQKLAEKSNVIALAHGAKFIKTTDFWCPNGKCRIWVEADVTRPIYWDGQHLTRYGMEMYAGFLGANETLRLVLNKNQQSEAVTQLSSPDFNID